MSEANGDLPRSDQKIGTERVVLEVKVDRWLETELDHRRVRCTESQVLHAHVQCSQLSILQPFLHASNSEHVHAEMLNTKRYYDVNVNYSSEAPMSSLLPASTWHGFKCALCDNVWALIAAKNEMCIAGLRWAAICSSQMDRVDCLRSSLSRRLVFQPDKCLRECYASTRDHCHDLLKRIELTAAYQHSRICCMHLSGDTGSGTVEARQKRSRTSAWMASHAVQ